MDLYWKAVAAVIVTVMLGLTVNRQDMTLLLTMGACVLVGLLGMTYLRPVVEFLRSLQELGALRGELLEILLKAMGVGLVTELTAMICRDGGNASLGQALQILGCGVILWLSIPLFTAFMDIIQKILGEV